MQNYQKPYYSNYQEMLPGGECVKVTRSVCFAPATPPTVASPHPQRWFYDSDSGLVIRLPRNKMGDDLGKRNAADLKAEERKLTRQTDCVAKSGEVQCPVSCSRCPFNGDCSSRHKSTNGAKCLKKCEACSQSLSRYVELDKPLGDEEDASVTYIELPDETADIHAILEDKALLSALISALNRLAPDDRELWDYIIAKTRKQTITVRFNLTLDGVRYREQRLFKILRSDEPLESLYKKD